MNLSDDDDNAAGKCDAAKGKEDEGWCDEGNIDFWAVEAGG